MNLSLPHQLANSINNNQKSFRINLLSTNLIWRDVTHLDRSSSVNHIRIKALKFGTSGRDLPFALYRAGLSAYDIKNSVFMFLFQTMFLKRSCGYELGRSGTFVIILSISFAVLYRLKHKC